MPTVHSVHVSPEHSFSKVTKDSINLVAGFGVEGDAHAGPTVKHRSRVAIDPTTPNLRQVHLIPYETLAALGDDGFKVLPGNLGENITTSEIDLHSLPVGALLRIGPDALIALTGLRNPCQQIDQFQDGLLKKCLPKDSEGNIQRRAGVMGIAISSGAITAGDEISVSLPPQPHKPLERI